MCKVPCISFGLIIMNLWRYCAVGTSCGGALLPSSSFAPKGIARGSDKKSKTSKLKWIDLWYCIYICTINSITYEMMRRNKLLIWIVFTNVYQSYFNGIYQSLNLAVYLNTHLLQLSGSNNMERINHYHLYLALFSCLIRSQNYTRFHSIMH